MPCAAQGSRPIGVPRGHARSDRMKTYGKSRTTAASPDRVWSLWSDPDNWSRWNSGIQSAKVDGPLASGVTGTMETSRGSKHAVTFANVQPGRHFEMSTGGPPGTTMTVICDIAPDAAGSTIAQSVGFSGPLAFLWGPLMGSQMATHFVPVLDDLASAAEAP
jgi:uncharacterized protein YndB with AHSA1/START domain